MARTLSCKNCGTVLYVSPFAYGKKCGTCGNYVSIPKDPPDSGPPADVLQLLAIARYNLSKGRWSEVKENCRYVQQLDEDNPEGLYLTLMAHLECKNLAEVDAYKGMFLNTNEFRVFAEGGLPHLVDRFKTVGERNYRRELLKLTIFRYRAACTIYENAKSPQDYRFAAECFGKILDFRDAGVLRQQCLARAEAMERNRFWRFYNFFF